MSQIDSVEIIPLNLVSSLGLSIGMLLAKNEKMFKKLLGQNLFGIILLLLFMSAYLYTTVVKYHGLYNSCIDVMCIIIAPVLFLFIFLIFVNYFKFGNFVLDKIAIVSYEVYLLHQLAIDMCKMLKWPSSITLFLIVIISVLLGWMLHQITKRINNIVLKKRT